MLKEIQKELQTQDNRATKDPIFIVYDIRKVTSCEGYSDKWMYVDTADGDEIGNSKEELLEYLNNNYDAEPPNDLDEEDLLTWSNNRVNQIKRGNQIEKWYYQTIRELKGVFFTEKAADLFIVQNQHNLSSEVHTYVEFLYRNPEMQYIRDCLEKGAFIEKENTKEDAIKRVKELIKVFDIDLDELDLGKIGGKDVSKG